MEVSGPGMARVRPPRVFPPDRIRQRGRRAEPSVPITREQLRRIAVSEAVFVHEDTPVEDRKVGPAVAVEVVRGHDRGASVDRPFDQLRRVPEAAVARADEHAQWRLPESLLGCRARGVVLASSRENVVAPGRR